MKKKKEKNCLSEALEKNCVIELKHIQIEIEHQRGQHLRHFIDQYFCYKHEYVTSNCNAAWKKINWNEHISKEADNNHDKKVTRDHIVPIKVLKKMLLDLGTNAEINEIRDLLDKYVCFATITKAENKKLNDAGLNSKMPDCCYDKNGNLKKNFDKFARYNKMNIVLIP